MSNKYRDIVISLLFVLILLLFFVLNVFKSDTLVSVSERRKLTLMPKFSLKSVFNGTYFSEVDKYTTDQFIHRDTFRTLKAKMDLNIKNNYHNLYIKDNNFIEMEYPLNINSVDNLINKINYIKDHYLKESNVYYSIIPDKNYFVNKGNLRIDYEYLENYMYDKLNFRYIDIFNTLKLDDYYKTDSHFMINKIDKVASRLLSGMNNYSSIDYSVEKVGSFDGVYKSRIPISSESDDLYIIKNDFINNSLVYDYSKKSYIDFYDKSKLKGNDKYEMYLGGSNPLISIYNNDTSSDRELVIFRDSFGSSLAPLLVSSYKTITLVDTRYMSPKILGNYIDFYNKDVLFIYNTSIINNSYSLK